ncbi:hypothetical protein SAMN04488058_1158 [Deinococcus reticulitermitis]|uniref:Uncharacterized protein n=1 Tax=Deinococcus reticulitermitis TaxID=856736 RepID=A0A1H7B9Y1_9DEIO|nr:hypothetical protein SAMN04488058_1158 [Deinococcus reticulitermitis]
MTTAQGRRLDVLEQTRSQRIEAHWEDLSSRALRLMTPQHAAAIHKYMSGVSTSDPVAALEQLQIWGADAAKRMNVPPLGEAGLSWWILAAESRQPLLPVASPEVVTDLERHAAQWQAVSEAADSSPAVLTAGVAALWAWWAALAQIRGA